VLIAQFPGSAFLDSLNAEFGAATRVDVATAWARVTGVGHLLPGFKEVLGRGGRVRIVVGLDSDNTSFEGLAMLLTLGKGAKVWVRHNEVWPIFHPKLYAFRSAAECRVFVGSNNMTGAGLVDNEEMSALLKEGLGGDLEQSLDEYLGRITAKGDGLARRLDEKLLGSLLKHGYVDREARLRGKSVNRVRTGRASKKLFGSVLPKRRALPKGTPLATQIEPDPKLPVGGWTRVFLRLRVARRTQGQLPVTVVREFRRRLGLTPEDGPLEVIHRGTGKAQIVTPTYPARAKGNAANTYKIEAFEPKGSVVVKLELIGRDVVLELVDTVDPVGASIERFILDGQKGPTPLTVSTRPGTANATLYRFD
jgi:HKD family nuclease